MIVFTYIQIDYLNSQWHLQNLSDAILRDPTKLKERPVLVRNNPD